MHSLKVAHQHLYECLLAFYILSVSCFVSPSSELEPIQVLSHFSLCSNFCHIASKEEQKHRCCRLSREREKKKKPGAFVFVYFYLSTDMNGYEMSKPTEVFFTATEVGSVCSATGSPHITARGSSVFKNPLKTAGRDKLLLLTNAVRPGSGKGGNGF